MTIFSLIKSLVGPVRKLSSKRNSISLWRKFDIIVAFKSENVMEVVKLARDFNIP